MRTANVFVTAGADRAGPPASTTITTDRTWTVGRSPDSDIVVDDSRVSRRHLVVENTGPAWIIRDVSANGSWAAGARIGPAGVAIPDVGEVRLHLGDSAGPELVVAGGQQNLAATLPVAPTLAELPTIPTGPAAFPPGPAAIPISAEGARAGPVHPAQQTQRSRRRRRTRWLVAVLVVLALLFVVADRIAAGVASSKAVAQVVQRSQGLSARPSVSFGGFPFLTQVIFGKYTDIKVGINAITPPGGPRIEHLSAHLKGAHIPLSKALHDNVTSIPVDHISADVAIGFADLNKFLASQPGNLVLSAGSGGAVQVSGNITEEGTPITVSGNARLEAQDGQLTVVPVDVHVSGAGGLGDLLDSLGGLSALFPPIPVPLPDLPFNVRITSVHASGNGILASAAADHVVLDAGQ
jgi:hypothetical protein